MNIFFGLALFIFSGTFSLAETCGKNEMFRFSSAYTDDYRSTEPEVALMVVDLGNTIKTTEILQGPTTWNCTVDMQKKLRICTTPYYRGGTATLTAGGPESLVIKRNEDGWEKIFRRVVQKTVTRVFPREVAPVE